MEKKFNTNDKVLILDFDHTCYDTDTFLLKEIREPMIERLRIPAKAWEESYERAAEIGYTPELHLHELVKIVDPPPVTIEEIQDFASFIHFDEYLFSDTTKFLQKAKQEGYKIMILSFGNKEWQDRKIFGCGLNKMVDLYVAVNLSETKADKVKEYTKGCKKIIFVDNNGKHLDEIIKIMPEVETYFINRVSNDAMNPAGDEYLRVRHMESRKIAERQALPIHKRCSSLEEVAL